MKPRLEQLRAALAERGLPALLVGSPANRRYVSGFTVSYGWLFVTPTLVFVLTDGRYRVQASREAADYAVREIVNPGKTMLELLAELAAEHGLKRIGFEAAHITVAEHAQVKATLGDAVELIPTKGMFEGLRTVKDAAEIQTLKRAIAITDAAMDAVVPRLRAEHIERQAAWMLEQALREGGGEALSFPIIAAASHREHFGHRLGHGIGLNVHEPPFLRWTLPDGTSAPLEVGMVTSVEPRIYIEGWGGVRIEDIVRVTPEGCEEHSHAAKL